MTPTTPEARFAEAIASEVRAEMGRQSKTKADLARALDISQHTAAKRLKGHPPFDATELFRVAQWLGVPSSQFWPEDVAS